MTLHGQQLPGLKYNCPDKSLMKKCVKFTGSDEDIVFHSHALVMFSNLTNY